MPKLLSSREVVKVLERRGFIFIAQHGSHAKYRNARRRPILTVIVPVDRKEIPHGTMRSILRQARLHESDFGITK